jgi:hypothetical protein
VRRPIKLLSTAPAVGVLALLTLSGAAQGAGGQTHLFRGLNAVGLTAANNKMGASGNPDTSGAIGRPGYLESVKVRLGLFDRHGLGRAGARDAFSFWNQDPIKGNIVDPQVVWDDAARRWYAAEVFNGTSADNQLLLAWSKTADPGLAHVWCTMAIRTGEPGRAIADFPMLGFSRKHIVIGTNLANLQTENIQTARIYAIGKPLEGDTSCSALPVHFFGRKSAPLRGADRQLALTPVAVNPVNPSGNGYVISADCPGTPPTSHEESCASRDRHSNDINVWHVHGPRGSPALTLDGAVHVPLYREPKPVPQPRSKRRLDASDARLTQAVSAHDPTRGGRLGIWTQHAVAGRHGRAVVRWYELDPHRLSLMRHGRIANRRNWVFNAAISPNSRGDGAVINYNLAGPHLLPEIRARSRGPGTSNRKMRHPIRLGRSAAPEGGCSITKTICVWGDYSAATPDPLHPKVVWGSNQFSRSREHADPFGANWGTRNFAVRTNR